MTVIGTAHVRWVDALPGRARRQSLINHELIADVLRSRPGQWAALPDVPGSSAGNIKGGTLQAYRPAGSFEAQMMQGVLYARYVGSARRGGSRQ